MVNANKDDLFSILKNYTDQKEETDRELVKRLSRGLKIGL